VKRYRGTKVINSIPQFSRSEIIEFFHGFAGANACGPSGMGSSSLASDDRLSVGKNVAGETMTYSRDLVGHLPFMLVETTDGHEQCTYAI